jgi:uncharacterized protein YoxC
MKRQVRSFLFIAAVMVFSAKLVYAEEQIPTASQVVTQTESEDVTQTENDGVTPTPSEVETSTEIPDETPTPLAEMTETPKPTLTPIPITIEVSGITDNSLFSDLVSKKQTIDYLVAEENQVCASIRDQEAANSKAAELIKDKIKSYSAPHMKIIDEIKALLSQIRDKRTQNIIQSDAGNETFALEKEMNNNQALSLNRALKYMRDSIKYISVESNELSKKAQITQQEIDEINENIAALNKKIIEDKRLKDIEWENFCSAMYNKDLTAANTSYQNIIEIKQHIIKTYNEILDLKKNIGEKLTPLAQ